MSWLWEKSEWSLEDRFGGMWGVIILVAIGVAETYVAREWFWFIPATGTAIATAAAVLVAQRRTRAGALLSVIALLVYLLLPVLLMLAARTLR